MVFQQVSKIADDGAQSAFVLLPAVLGHRSGSQLLSWTQDAVAAIPQTLPEPKPKGKHSLLPVLIVLFLISYGLMSLLAVEQDRTIASQRWLIRSLLSDSSELSSLKGKMIQQQHGQDQSRAGARTQTPSARNPSAQNQMAPAPLTQVPTTQVPTIQAPTTQAPTDAPTANSQGNHKTGKLRTTVPQKPPLGVADVVDGRRIVKTI
jgi:hypothetical protein